MKNMRVVFTIMTLGWMLLIFGFSAQDATDSTNTSSGLTEVVAYCFVQDFDTWSAEEQQNLLADMEFPVRKCAHATEYAILGTLWYGLLLSYRVPGRKCFFAALAASVLYAASDEFHQLFVPGRSGQIPDVLIDSLGAGIGCLLTAGGYSLIVRLACRRKNS